MLDVGCGIGGTGRYLARNRGCKVVGLTISGQQVEMARRLSGPDGGDSVRGDGFVGCGDGEVRFVELDAESMAGVFGGGDSTSTFDCVWISEAMSHLPDKSLFFRNASALLDPGGKLVVADWFKADGLSDTQLERDIKPIEGTVFVRESSHVPLIVVVQTECYFPRSARNPSTLLWPRSRAWMSFQRRWILARRSPRLGELFFCGTLGILSSLQY